MFCVVVVVASVKSKQRSLYTTGEFEFSKKKKRNLKETNALFQTEGII